MGEKQKTVSVIICAYTERRWVEIEGAVASVQQQTRLPTQLILVVDHNRALYERARARFADVAVIENQEARGLSGARNSGIAAAAGDIIAFMDEDAYAAPDWLAGLVAVYDSPRVLGVGGAVLPRWEAARAPWLPEEFFWVVGCSYRGLPERMQPVRNLIGCNMSFRRDVLARCGGFRHDIGRIGTLPVGCEETELCIRARQCFPDGDFYYQPSAAVHHHVPTHRARWAYFRSRCYSEGISKALVTQYVGSRDGLASEWTYTLQTLPAGVLRGLTASARGDLSGLLRAWAIVVGLVLTTAGYARGRVTGRRSAGKAAMAPHA